MTLSSSPPGAAGEGGKSAATAARLGEEAVRQKAGERGKGNAVAPLNDAAPSETEPVFLPDAAAPRPSSTVAFFLTSGPPDRLSFSPAGRASLCS